MATCRLDVIHALPVPRTHLRPSSSRRRFWTHEPYPPEYPEDALHIAGMDFIVTWNFAHINNPFTKMKIRHAVENVGYECPEIVSPDAFLGDQT